MSGYSGSDTTNKNCRDVTECRPPAQFNKTGSEDKMKKQSTREKAFTVLWWQIAELQKALGDQTSIQECFLMIEIFQMRGTAGAYNGNFKCLKTKASTARHLQALENKGLITYERKFRDDTKKYADLTDQGDYLMARLIRLSRGEMA
jgi:DNA-binding transcriptional ArsR family regulator